jgi:hypothetical protein
LLSSTPVLGASATSSGIRPVFSSSAVPVRRLMCSRMLPYSLSSAVASALSGMLVTRIGSYRPVMWFGWTAMTLGWGTMIMLDNTSAAYVYVQYRS